MGPGQVPPMTDNPGYVLDLFCGEGGAAMGYHRAGFRVIGVDAVEQPRYPFEFHRMDWRDGLGQFATLASLIHASPPCQDHSSLAGRVGLHGTGWMLPATINALLAVGRSFVVENVARAEMDHNLVLCGSMFGMAVRRHRKFLTSFPVKQPECRHSEQGTPLGVYGHGGGGHYSRGTKAYQPDWAGLMRMTWASVEGISQAIPPMYTEYIGRQFHAS